MINQIILSCNEDSTYSSFWEPVSWAYKKMFPDVKVHLAFLTNRSEDDEMVKEFRKHGEVTLFPIVPNVPEFSQAKMIRFVLASMQGDDVCYIDDIDLFPLKRTFITNKTDKRPEGKLLCVGGEVYGNNGCYPVSQMTAEGYVWKKLINPSDKTWPELVRKWIKDKPRYDKKESMMVEMNTKTWQYFSDERLLRRLQLYNHVPVFEMERGYNVNEILLCTLDRMQWKVDVNRLKNHGYENAHGRRPYSKYKDDYVELINYINKNY